MLDVAVIEEPAAAEASLDPIRARILAALAEPGSAAMLAAYAADPALAAMRLDFTGTLREVLEVLIAGLLSSLFFLKSSFMVVLASFSRVFKNNA